MLLQVSGNITYNGKNFHEFQAVHTSAYVDQNDLHIAELTVRETLDFAARCQGIGHKAGECSVSCFHTPAPWPVQGPLLDCCCCCCCIAFIAIWMS